MLTDYTRDIVMRSIINGFQFAVGTMYSVYAYIVYALHYTAIDSLV